MDWTKVRTKHYISNGLSNTECGILVRFVCLVAHLEKMPTLNDLQFTFRSKWKQIEPRFKTIYGHSCNEIAVKVLQDVEKVARKKKRDCDYHKTYDKSRHSHSPHREEKIREDNTIPPISPKGFEDFWNAYPKKKAKAVAEKAFKKLPLTEDLLKKILSSVERQKHSEQWKRDNGQFIPYPATWLNGKRWEDGGDHVVLVGAVLKSPSATCTACNSTGILPDGKKCWCY